MNINEIAKLLDASGRKATSDLLNAIIKDNLNEWKRSEGCIDGRSGLEKIRSREKGNQGENFLPLFLFKKNEKRY
jgi:hypothetical protein